MREIYLFIKQNKFYVFRLEKSQSNMMHAFAQPLPLADRENGSLFWCFNLI